MKQPQRWVELQSEPGNRIANAYSLSEQRIAGSTVTLRARQGAWPCVMHIRIDRSRRAPMRVEAEGTFTILGERGGRTMAQPPPSPDVSLLQ